MKKSYFYIIAMLIIFGCSKNDDIKESRWKILKTSTTNELKDIFFSSNDFGAVCGSFGTFLKTVDAGNSWQNIDVGVGYSFSSVFVINNNEFFTSRIGLYKTINAGESFNEIGNLSTFGATISDIYFFNSQEGMVCKGGAILSTVDSGNNWITVYDYEGYASILEVADNNTIYLAGGRTYDSLSEGEMYKSIDKGETWEVLNLPAEIANSEITAIDFLDSHRGYISTFESKIFNTIDGGNKWNRKAELNIGPIVDMVYVNEEIGYLVCQNKIYRTKDGGVEWNKEYQSETNYLTAITAAPNGTIYVSGQSGILLKRE